MQLTRLDIVIVVIYVFLLFDRVLVPCRSASGTSLACHLHQSGNLWRWGVEVLITVLLRAQRGHV